MSQNEIEAKPGLPERGRSNEGLGVTARRAGLSATGTEREPGSRPCAFAGAPFQIVHSQPRRMNLHRCQDLLRGPLFVGRGARAGFSIRRHVSSSLPRRSREPLSSGRTHVWGQGPVLQLCLDLTSRSIRPCRLGKPPIRIQPDIPLGHIYLRNLGPRFALPVRLEVEALSRRGLLRPSSMTDRSYPSRRECSLCDA